MNGQLIVLEGLDGSGKGTQIRLLTDVIDRFGFELVLSREPGGCPISEKLREIMGGIYDASVAAAEEYGLGDDLIAGNDIAAFKKIAQAMMAQGL